MKRVSFYNLQLLLTKDERSIIYKKLNWLDWHIACIAHNPRILQMFKKGLSTILIDMSYYAVLYNHLDILKWLGEQEITFNETTCANAAKAGHLDILKWLREQGTRWNIGTCYFAAINNHLHVLEWCITQDAPMYTWTINYCHEKKLL